MDHVAWVTMTDQGPNIVNLLLNGMFGKQGLPEGDALEDKVSFPKGRDGMSETQPIQDPAEDKAQARARRVYLVVEVMAVIVVAGAVLWLAQNYRPRSFIGRGLVNYRLWILVLLVSSGGTAASLIPYYVGQRGTNAVFERYPRLEGRPWERLEATFQRWGAFTLILSGIPGLGAALLVAAGAFGIERRVFLCWVFLGKVLRYWVVVFVVLFSLQLVR
jgi:membrane protein YqaA with SNARE-associated domain